MSFKIPLPPNIQEYIYNVSHTVLKLLIYFILGIICLFMCKVCGSNLLPIDEKLQPYTNTPRKLTEVQQPVFKRITKIVFPVSHINVKNNLIDSIRSYQTYKTTNVFKMYFSSILISIIVFNYSTLHYIINNIINYYMSELFIIILAPIIFFILFIILYIINNIYFIYLYFSELGWFFKYKTCNISAPWKDICIFDGFDFFRGICIAWILVFCFIITWLIGALPTVTIVFLWVIFSLFSFFSVINNMNANVFNFVQYAFKYYSNTLLLVICFILTMHAFSILGTYYGVVCGILFLILGWQSFMHPIYAPITSAASHVVSHPVKTAQSGGKNKKHKYKNNSFYKMLHTIGYK